MKKDILKKGGKSISRNKIKMARGYSYVSVFGIPFLVARELGKMFPEIGWVFLFIAAVVGIWIMGHIDFKKGLWGNELEFGFTKNPEWRKLSERVEKMEENFKQSKK